MLKRLIIVLIIYIVPIVAKDNFALELNKTKAYLNEPLLATFTLTYPKDDKPRFIKFEDLENRDFLIKKIKEKKITLKSKESIKYYYLIIPQVAKVAVFKPKIIKVARLEPKTSMVIWKSLDSKEKTITIKALPQDAVIAGDLKLNVDVKKREKRVVDVTIGLSGVANMDDIEPFGLNIKEATIYSAKPEITYSVDKEHLNAKFSQKITILATKDITLPSINFNYFNTNTQMIELLKSRKVKVDIGTLGGSKNIWLWLLIGLILGLLLAFLYIYFKRAKLRVNLPLHQKVKLCQSNRCLYRVLLPYVNRYDLSEIIKKLEESIYEGKKIKIDKKEILNKLGKRDSY